MAGAFVALAGVASTWASMTISDPSIKRLIAGCIFPAGLAMVGLTGAGLFTGCCLMSINVLNRAITIGQMIRAWILVYIGNLAGSILIAWLVANGQVFAGYEEILIATANAKLLEPTVAICRGILCNILVCVGITMASKVNDAGSKVVAMFFPVAAFVIAGYEHSVANMYYFAVAQFVGAGLPIQQILQCNLIPVTIGNIIGGAIFLGGSLWYIQLPNRKSHT